MEEEIIQKLQKSAEIYVLFSNATHCPFVVCDEDTADDEIFLYFSKQEGEADRDRRKESGYLLALVTVDNSQLLFFYSSLYTMGINALMVSGQEGQVRIQLEKLVRRKLPQKSDGQVWVENPQLHLTSLYLMQEVRKSGAGSSFTEEQADLLEEIGADLASATLIQPVLKDQKAIPMLQLKGGEKFQPLFTDILEFRKFNTDDQFRPLIVKPSELPKILLPQASGILLNPGGVNLPLKMERKAQARKNDLS